MLRRTLMAAAAAVGLVAAAPAARAAAYVDPAAWLAAVGGAEVVAFPNLPVSAMVLEDFAGTYTTDDRGGSIPTYSPGGGLPVVSVPRFHGDAQSTTGSFSGEFGCHSAGYQCIGAWSITYTLPFEIIGLAGDLVFRWGTQIGQVFLSVRVRNCP